MKITRMLLLGFALMITLLAAACSSGSATPTSIAAPTIAAPTTTTLTTAPAGAASTVAAASTGSPQDAVKNFFVAIYGGQDPSALICSAFANAADPFTLAASASRATGGSVDTSGLTFTVKNQTSSAATVTVAGQLAYNGVGNTTTAQFPSSDISAVNEGGTWKYCGPAS